MCLPTSEGSALLRRKRPTAPAAVPRPAAFALPAPGRVVSVGLEDVGLSWRSRVEASGGVALELVAPTRALGDAIVPEVGRPVLVAWSEEDGYLEAECVFAAPGVDRVVTWVLTVHRVARLQRRAAFRIETGGPVRLRVGERSLDGHLRNVSEGGLGCAVPAAGAPSVDAQVVVEVDLQDLGPFETSGRVVRVAASTQPGEVELGVAFVGLDAERIEGLRQFVFAEQLRRRRALSGR